MRRLGQALGARVDDVLQGTIARGTMSGPGSRGDLDPTVAARFEEIGTSSTIALAHWLAGGDPESGRSTGQEAWQTYGQFAAHSEAPLHEVTKRCLRWRDAVIEVLRASAAELGLSAEAVAQAAAMTQRTIDVTLVRMCEAFEQERERVAGELNRRDEELAFIAMHDELTGLANRRLIVDRGDQMLARGRRSGGDVAILVIDIDNFASINDTLGHGVGDKLLQAVASRLEGAVRNVDALGRLGGDRFVVLAEELSDGADGILIAERVHEALEAPFALRQGTSPDLRVTASVGVASGGGAPVEELLRDADVAMQYAKREGKDRHVVFEPGMHDVIQVRMELEMDVRAALAKGEFFLVYQPTFDIQALVPTGVEALLRWRHRTRGVVPPNEFVPLLEETGLIVPVGAWVLAEACREAGRWQHGNRPLGVAINVSARQLETDLFISDIRSAIEQNGIEPSRLTLEITETALMRNPEQIARRLHAIKDIGVRIAIDDFGTGYSSFSHLQRFPVDTLKIDRSFVSQLRENPEGETLLRTLVQLGKELAIDTLAEGIEHEHQLSVLQAEACASGQGYLFARPLDADAAAAVVQNWRPGELAGADVGSPSRHRPVGAISRS